MGDWVWILALALLAVAVAVVRESPSPPRNRRRRPAPRSPNRTYRSITEPVRRQPIGGGYPGWWGDLLRRYDYRCAYCAVRGDYKKLRLHKEHVIPLARGGQHHVSNVVPACARCNFVKGTLTGDEFRALIVANDGTVPTSRAKPSPSTPRGPSLRDLVLTAVRRLDATTEADDWAVSEIVEAIRSSGSEAPLPSLRATISTMGTTGSLLRTSRGRYRLPD